MFLKLGYAGGTVGQSLAVGWPPEVCGHRAASLKVMQCIGQGVCPWVSPGETSFRVWVWVQKLSLNT